MAGGDDLNRYSPVKNGRNNGGVGYILMNSVTYAMKAQRLLERHGFRAFAMRDRGINRDFGCGYIIKVYCGDKTLADAEKLLQNAGIPLRKYPGEAAE